MIVVNFEETTGMLLRTAYMAFRRRIQAHCALFGVTSDQFVLLTLLDEKDGITQGKLAERSCTDASTMTAMLRLMDKNGLIRRNAHTRDGRARQVFLTEKGRGLQRRIFLSHRPLIQRLEEGISPQERTIIANWLGRVRREMRRINRRRLKAAGGAG